MTCAHLKKALLDRLGGLGMFAGMPKVTEIAMAGYSWGGGTAADFTNTIKSGYFKDIEINLALIDAVQPGYEGMALPVNQRPMANSVFNRYQDGGTVTHESILQDITLLNSKYSSPIPGYKLLQINMLMTDIAMVGLRGEPAKGEALKGMLITDDEGIVTHLINDNNSVHHINIDDKDALDPRNPNREVSVTTEAINFLLNRIR